MTGVVRLLLAALPILRMLMRWAEQRRIKKEATKIATDALKQEEARASKQIAETMAERRPDDDAARRLRDGTV
jgi:hypothetical protein